LVILGHAGDRTDEAIRELARVAWQSRPDRVVIRTDHEHFPEIGRQIAGRTQVIDHLPDHLAPDVPFLPEPLTVTWEKLRSAW
jgi:hypothetical protein